MYKSTPVYFKHISEYFQMKEDMYCWLMNRFGLIEDRWFEILIPMDKTIDSIAGICWGFEKLEDYTLFILTWE